MTAPERMCAPESEWVCVLYLTYQLLTDLAALFQYDHSYVLVELLQPNGCAQPCGTTANNTHIHFIFCPFDLRRIEFLPFAASRRCM